MDQYHAIRLTDIEGRALRAAAQAEIEQRREEALTLAQQAGVGRDFLILHNAWVGQQNGRPWPLVFSDLLEQAHEAEAHIFDPARDYERWEAQRREELRCAPLPLIAIEESQAAITVGLDTWQTWPEVGQTESGQIVRAAPETNEFWFELYPLRLKLLRPHIWQDRTPIFA